MFTKSVAMAAVISALALGAASATSAASSGAASATLQISGFVPVICRAQLDSAAAPSQAGQVPLGQMNEFCNDANGYEVWVDYSQNLAGDTLTVDGQAIPLTAAGSVRIDASSGPNVASKSVVLNVPDNGVSGAVSIRVVAL